MNSKLAGCLLGAVTLLLGCLLSASQAVARIPPDHMDSANPYRPTIAPPSNTDVPLWTYVLVAVVALTVGYVLATGYPQLRSWARRRPSALTRVSS